MRYVKEERYDDGVDVRDVLTSVGTRICFRPQTEHEHEFIVTDIKRGRAFLESVKTGKEETYALDDTFIVSVVVQRPITETW